MSNKTHTLLNNLKLVFLTVTLAFVLINSTNAQIPSIQTLSKEFVEYQKKIADGTWVNKTADGHNLGYVPSPIKPKFNFTHTISTTKKLALPAVYDMRTNNKITSVKNQGDCGSCWTFGCIGSIESGAKILGLGDLDLAENGLNYCNGFDTPPCEGGDATRALAYFLRAGILSESDDPYLTNVKPNCGNLAPKAKYLLNGAFYLPQDRDAIKQAVMDYGAATHIMCWDESAYDESNKTFYYNGDANANHMVLIVGWDDNKVTQAANPGAWILRNSWGNGWGENGFFYLSYDDKYAVSWCQIFNDIIPYDSDMKINGYDDFGLVKTVGLGNEYYGLLKFDANSAQSITRLGTYAVSDSTTITFDIYDNFNGTTLSGLLGSKTVKPEFPGYCSVDLDSPINITAGNDYYVRVKYLRIAQVADVIIPVEEKLANYSSNATIETGKCWISPSADGNWEALGTNKAIQGDICLKVYIKGAKCPSPQPVFSVNATNFKLCANTSTTITVTPQGNNYVYQWQVSSDQGITWNNVLNNTIFSGANTSSLQLVNIPLNFNGRRFRCMVSSGTCFSIPTVNITSLSITSSASIINQPVNRNMKKMSQTTFAITLSTTSGTTMQWQVSTNNGSSWANLSATTQYPSVTKTTLTVKGISLGMNGYRYRCLVNLKCGSQLISNAGILTVVGAKTTAEEELVSIASGEEVKGAVLSQNYPNPLTGETTILFSLNAESYVAVELVNNTGLKVAQILEPQIKSAGVHEILFNRNGLTAGTYIYTLLYKSILNEDWKRISKTLIIQ